MSDFDPEITSVNGSPSVSAIKPIHCAGGVSEPVSGRFEFVPHCGLLVLEWPVVDWRPVSRGPSPVAGRRVYDRSGILTPAERADLEQRGWFDTQVGQQRRPLFISGVLAIVLGAVGLAAAFIARDLPGVIGPVLLVGTGFAAIFAGALLPATTAEGAYEAGPWRAYREGLTQSKRPAFDLDEALPYAVALGSAGAIEPHLKRASSRGYAPAWFVRGRALQPDDVGFYPYWVGFHSAVAPSSSGGGSSSGASAGGAGASGSF